MAERNYHGDLRAIEVQLRRIADALERANPQRDTTFEQPWAPPPTAPMGPYFSPGWSPNMPTWRSANTDTDITRRRVPIDPRLTEGDWILDPEADHTGEETD
jgi:hypothetical protein